MEKIALVTGYSTWLGKEIVDMLVSMNYIVYASSRKPNVSSSTSAIHIYPLDITNKNQCFDLIKKIITKHQHIDLLINIAGINNYGPIENSDESQLKGNLDINVGGAFNTMKAVLPYMQKQKSGHIINICSLNSFLASPNFSTYCASKFALYGLSMSLAIELSHLGIKVLCVAPGALKSRSGNETMSHKSARETIPLLKLLLPLTSTSEVAGKIQKIISGEVASPLVLIGRDSYLIYYLQKFIPQRIWFEIQKWIWQKQTKH